MNPKDRLNFIINGKKPKSKIRREVTDAGISSSSSSSSSSPSSSSSSSSSSNDIDEDERRFFRLDPFAD